MAIHNEIGKLGEDLAVEFLEKEGFKIFDRNYNFERSEIDIVALWEEPTELHIIEVKTRSNTQFNHPEESLTEQQQENIARVTRFYLRERQLVSVPVVFDLIAVSLDDPNNPEIKHLEDIFRPS